MIVTVNEVLDMLVSKSNAPSNFGAQLERMRDGIQCAPDPFRARDEVEANMLHDACIIRFLDNFQAKHEFLSTTRKQRLGDAGYKTLEKLQCASKLPQGHIAVGILRAYHERATMSQERGLLEVYNYLVTIAPGAVPTPPKGTKDLYQAFRTGEAKRARTIAAEAYADSLLALQNHSRIWNKRS